MPKGPTNPSGPHLNEAVFRRYENELLAFVSNYPAVHSFQPRDFAVTTAAAQLRNAINAHVFHAYESKVDPNALHEAWQASMITRTANTVFIGPPESVRETLATAGRGVADLGYYPDIENPSIAELDALATLFTTSALTRPARLRGVLPRWSPPPGIAFGPEGDAYIMLA